MVPVLDTTENLMQILNYNEKKVQQKKAVLIHAGNFLKEKDQLTFYDKKGRFEQMNSLHPTSKVNMLHVSVNFHPSETISPDLIKSIAEKYMAGIGLPEQPFLVYQHFDAAHPHFHIVTNLIRPDGSRLRTNNLGKNESRKIADSLEKEYNLVPAKGQKKAPGEPKAIDVRKIRSGKSEVKKSIQDVLRHVLKDYKVTSIPELNAILRQYNVVADPGRKGSRMFENKGLIYKVVNEDGSTTTVPIKASDFYFKPTLKNLEIKFEKDKESRKELLRGIRTRIDWTLRGEPENIEELKTDLLKEGIQLVTYQNSQGIIYGATYIDYKSKTVVKGSDLGSAYSANGLRQGLDIVQSEFYPSAKPAQTQQLGTHYSKPVPSPNTGAKQQPPRPTPLMQGNILQPLSDLMRAEDQFNPVPFELRQKKKKRKRR